MSTSKPGKPFNPAAGKIGNIDARTGRFIAVPKVPRGPRRHMFSSRAQERPNMYTQLRGNIRSNILASEGSADESQSATMRRASHTERGGPVRVESPEASKSHDIDMGIAVSTGSDTDSEPLATKKRFAPPRKVSTRSPQAQIRDARLVVSQRAVRNQAATTHSPRPDVPMLKASHLNSAQTDFSAVLQQNGGIVSTGGHKGQAPAVPAMFVFGPTPAVSNTTPKPVIKAKIGRKRFPRTTQRAAASVAGSQNQRAFNAVVDSMTRMDLGE